MVETGQQALEGSVQTGVAPASGNLHKGIGETADSGEHTLLHFFGIHNTLILGIACTLVGLFGVELVHINFVGFDYSACYSLFCPFACGFGLHLHDAHTHAELEGVGETPAAFDETFEVATQTAASGLVVAEHLVLDALLVPQRLVLEVLQAGHDGVEIVDNTVVDGLHIVVNRGIFLVHLILEIGVRTRNVCHFLCSHTVVKEVDGLHLRQFVDGGMMEKRHQRVLHQGVVATGTTVEYVRKVVGRGEGSVGIGEVGVRHHEVSGIVVGTEVILILVGVCTRHTVFLAATECILCREAVSEDGLEVFHGLVYLFLHGLLHVIYLVDVALVLCSVTLRLVDGKLRTGLVIVETRLQRKARSGEHHHIYD